MVASHHRPLGPEEHQDEARSMGCRYADLLVMEACNDPFYWGRPAQIAATRWFAEHWDRYGFNVTGAHLRRVHYRLLSEGAMHPTAGRPYRNDQNDWETMNRGARGARYMGLVDPELVRDERNPDAIVNVTPRLEPDPEITLDDPLWLLPRLSAGLPELEMPGVTANGYGYDPADQPVMVEVWIEKSTMNDVLVPLCRRLGVNLASGAGYQSIGNVYKLLRRAEAYGRAAHVLFISDYDPAGGNMPRQAGRQCEYWQHKIPEFDLPLAITALALTREQIDTYGDIPMMFDRHASGGRSGRGGRAGQGSCAILVSQPGAQRGGER